MAEATGRVTGVGGVFLRSPAPQRLAAWYEQHLGIKMKFGTSGVLMWSDEIPKGTGMTTWGVFKHDSDYFPHTQQAMVNYRVDDMDALLAKLKKAGVWIDPKRMDESYGKFAWIQDCDGNRLELWQPVAMSEDEKKKSSGE